MDIRRFVKETAKNAHGGTILSEEFLPEGMEAPFGAAYGYLQPGGRMEAHKHDDVEIYVILQGSASMTIGQETTRVEPGQVVGIPANRMHTIEPAGDRPLLWAAIWWEAA